MENYPVWLMNSGSRNKELTIGSEKLLTTEPSNSTMTTITYNNQVLLSHQILMFWASELVKYWRFWVSLYLTKFQMKLKNQLSYEVDL